MLKIWKRILSAVLSASMLVSFIPNVFAEEANNDGRSYFDFEASEYEVGENDGELKIKIVRHGEGNEAADVVFKAADFLSEYGTDYEIIGENGKPLEKVFGEKPDVSELVYDGDESLSDEVAEQANENNSGQEDAANEAVGDQTDASGDIEDVNAEDVNVEVYSVDSELPESDGKKRKNTGSPLQDAQREYLNLPENTDDEEAKASIDETLDDLYNYFLSAQGASGTVHFDTGETEKTVTIKVNNNDLAEQNKIFMLALMGTDTDNTVTAANATTYVVITDDEPAETAHFDLEDDGLVLTSSAQEGYVTIRRSGATQYFATVYVSTVKDTAAESAYESFADKAVAFVPGEIEKKVKVTAKDFSKDAKFGIRLEGESNVEIGNHYIDVNIASEQTAVAGVGGDVALMSNNEDVSLMASDVTLGLDTIRFDIEVPGGWKSVVAGDGSTWSTNPNNSPGLLGVKNYESGKYSMWVTNQKQNFIGVKNIRYSSYVTNVDRGFNTKYDTYYTYFETDSDQSFEGSLDSICLSGNKQWEERVLTLNKSGDEAYIKFATSPRSTGYDNPQAELDWLNYNYAKYNFSPQNSVENFNRQVYDFTQGTPNVYDTFYDGETTRIYNPGSVVIKRGNDTVSGFYTSNGEQVTISSAEEASNKSKGIYLKGVYFAANDMDAHLLYSNGKYTTKKCLLCWSDKRKSCNYPKSGFCAYSERSWRYKRYTC